jgi:hypothetical protein
MGCDIHMCVEVKRNINSVERWVSADHFRLNPYFDPNDQEESQYALVGLFTDRSYAAFDCLAGVRSYSDDSPRISNPRGVPADASATTLADIAKWDGDGHSHSYVTLREVIQFNEQKFEREVSGMVDPATAQALDENGVEPSMWCGWTSREEYVQRSWKQQVDALVGLESSMRQRLSEVMRRDDPEFHDKIRIVFWFDN